MAGAGGGGAGGVADDSKVHVQNSEGFTLDSLISHFVSFTAVSQFCLVFDN